MERTPKGMDTLGFSVEAVNLVKKTGTSVGVAAKQLSMPKSSLDNWGWASREGKWAGVGKGQRLPSELELELAWSRKDLDKSKMGWDLLEEFATHFAKESR